MEYLLFQDEFDVYDAYKKTFYYLQTFLVKHIKGLLVHKAPKNQSEANKSQKSVWTPHYEVFHDQWRHKENYAIQKTSYTSNNRKLTNEII